MIFNILDNTTKLWMTKYIIGEIFSSGGATLYKNPSDQTVKYCLENFVKSKTYILAQGLLKPFGIFVFAFFNEIIWKYLPNSNLNFGISFQIKISCTFQSFIFWFVKIDMFWTMDWYKFKKYFCKIINVLFFIFLT